VAKGVEFLIVTVRIGFSQHPACVGPGAQEVVRIGPLLGRA
jgi:hypothetical protein